MALPKNSSLSLCATFDSVSASLPNRDMILISILIPRFLLEAECTRLSPYSGCLIPQLLKVFLKKIETYRVIRLKSNHICITKISAKPRRASLTKVDF